MMRLSKGQKRAIDVLSLLMVVAAIVIGVMAWNQGPGPVCHAPAEDGQITDCDYRDGGWYPR